MARTVRGAIGGPARASDLLSYLESLAMVDDFEEVNFMQLLRHGAFVTSNVGAGSCGPPGDPHEAG